MSEANEQAADKIWAEDLFDRRNEAIQLSAYIESLVGRPALREDKQAFTIAVDAGYGEGKSFFLRRFAEHLALNHPVAFVDAWADDLADEPLTALAATLKKALEPFIDEPEFRSRVTSFMRKTGQVAKIASLGLVRRGIGLAITGGALAGIEEVITGADEHVQDVAADAVKDASNEIVSDSADAIRNVTANDLMEKRVAEFEAGREAIKQMKDSLSAIVRALDSKERHPPIVVIIDELDRCRPTYAIKLLEEIKHLFDVPGLVFVLGIHSCQLAHSVSGAYGSSFDGRAYLRRFIDREFSLATPSLYPLVSRLCKAADLMPEKIRFLPITHVERGRANLDFAAMIAEYMRVYGLVARDAFQLVDILQTSVALVDARCLEGVYLVPLAIGYMKGVARGTLPPSVKSTSFSYFRARSATEKEKILITFEAAALEFQQAAQMSDRQLHQNAENSSSWGVRAICETRDWDARPRPLWDIERYPDLVATVGRFKNPSLSPADIAEPSA